MHSIFQWTLNSLWSFTGRRENAYCKPSGRAAVRGVAGAALLRVFGRDARNGPPAGRPEPRDPNSGRPAGRTAGASRCAAVKARRLQQSGRRVHESHCARHSETRTRLGRRAGATRSEQKQQHDKTCNLIDSNRLKTLSAVPNPKRSVIMVLFLQYFQFSCVNFEKYFCVHTDYDFTQRNKSTEL